MNKYEELMLEIIYFSEDLIRTSYYIEDDFFE